MTDPSWAVRQLPVSAWPAADAAAWTVACNPRPGPFSRRKLSPYTYRNYARSYGAFLWHLTTQGELDPAESPAQRVTLARLENFYEHLARCGNANTTITTRFEDLRSAMQLMEPDGDFAFITKPGTVSIRQLLPNRPRARFVPDARHCVLWAEGMFKGAVSLPHPTFRRRLVRDSVFLGILASRAPRLRAMMGMQLGRHVIRNSEGWTLFFDEPLMKGGKTTLELPLGSRVGAMLERYLTVERPELLGGRTHDFLWVARDGAPLSANSANAMIRLRTKKEFDVAFGAHRFRTSLTTTQAVIDGKNPLGASLILGHTPQTGLKDYNHAKGLEASRCHDVRISEAEDAAARMLGRRQDWVCQNKPTASPRSLKRQTKSRPATARPTLSTSSSLGRDETLPSSWMKARRRRSQRD